MTDPTFEHTDAGTPERDWLHADGWGSASTLALPAGTYVVVAAHPDDEVLGAGATLADLAAEGYDVRVVVLTDGEASHPGSTVVSPARLGALRRAESAAALACLSPQILVTHLGIPDGRVGEHRARVAAALRRCLGPDTVLVSPWTRDGHPDHDAAGEVSASVAAETDVPHLMYPVWWWHRGNPADHPWSATAVNEPRCAALRRKRAAVSAYRSQVEPLSQLPGDEVLLGSHVVERFLRPFEAFVTGHRAERITQVAGTPETEAFDAMFDAGDDPWGFTSSWYEQRKRSLLVATLPRRRYEHAVEIGCSTGLLSADLAARSSRVTALDASSRALQLARDRLPGEVTCLRAVVPDELPETRADLVVLSEVGYFLTGIQLIRTLQWCVHTLAGDGTLVLCHWQHPSHDIPLDGPLVHAAARRMLGSPRVTYHDDDVEILVFHPGLSPAAAERLTPHPNPRSGAPATEPEIP